MNGKIISSLLCSKNEPSNIFIDGLFLDSYFEISIILKFFLYAYKVPDDNGATRAPSTKNAENGF